jgi:hypothetical protein
MAFSFSRSAFGFALAAMVGLTVLLLSAPKDAAAADLNLEGDWKSVLPEPELIKIVDDSVKYLQDATKSTTELRTKAKPAENRAYVVLLCAQAGMSGEGDMARKSAILKDASITLAQAIKKQDLAAAKKQVETLAKFKTMKPDGDAKVEAVDLAKAIPIENLMKEVTETDKKLQEYKRLTAAAFTAQRKPDEIATASYKMAALTMAITAHVPENDPDPKEKDKEKQKMSKKLWLESTAEVREATLLMASAAKAKKAADFKSAYAKMDSACTKCHDVFRKTE